MNILKRDRVMVFRLSQDEYEHLRSAAEVNGGRSVSDFIRSTLLAQVSPEHQATPVRLRELEQRVRRLESASMDLGESAEARA